MRPAAISFSFKGSVPDSGVRYVSGIQAVHVFSIDTLITKSFQEGTAIPRDPTLFQSHQDPQMALNYNLL